MKKRGRFEALGVACAVLLGGAMAGANAAAEPRRDDAALAVARRMADALTGAKAMRLTAEIAYDAVQEDGQAIEFGASRSFSIRRPDRALVEAVDRSGAKRRLVYDGKQIVFVDEEDNVYATSDFSGELDGMLDHLRDELRVPTPLAELLSKDLYDLLAKSESAQWVDEQAIGGVVCDHVAFRTPEAGLQIWVPREGDPVPRRIVIDYEQAEGRPQFRADLRDWDLSPRLDDALFRFTPAEGAEKIQFRRDALPVRGAPGVEKEDAQ